MRMSFFLCLFVVALYVGHGSVWGQNIPATAPRPLSVGLAQMPPNHAQPLYTAPNQVLPNQTPPKRMTVNGEQVDPQQYARQQQFSPQPSYQATSPQPGMPQLAVNTTQATYGTAAPNPAYGNAHIASPQAQPSLVPENPASPLSSISRPQVSAPQVPIQQQLPTPPAPFQLTSEQLKELDAFLLRWEEQSSKIKRFELGFILCYFAGGVDPNSDPTKETFRAYGLFNYVAPDKILYNVLGEIKDGKLVKESRAEKKLYDGKSFYEYDFNAKKVVEYPLTPEMRSKGVADGPLPLIFGAKADDMKRRYWMRIVTEPSYREKEVWLEIWPRWREDAVEFNRIELRLDAVKLEPIAMRKHEINGLSKTDYIFRDVKINNSLDKMLEIVKSLFTPDVPFGWTREVRDFTAQMQPQQVAGQNLMPNSASLPQPAQETPAAEPPKTLELYTPPDAHKGRTIYR